MGSQPIESGGDRALFDSRFGESVEAKLGALYEDTCELLEDNRAEVLAVAHALETAKTITGDDVAAIIEGEPGPSIDGSPYHEPFFRQMLSTITKPCCGLTVSTPASRLASPSRCRRRPSRSRPWPSPASATGRYAARIGMDPHSPPRPEGS